MLLTCIAAFPASAAQAPVELTVLTMRWGDMGDTFTNNQWLKDTEAKLGVKINWQVVSSNDWAEKRGILLAGGQLPDIFIGNQTMTDADVTSNRDYFLELTDVVNQYMPNYKHALEAIPAMKKIVTEVDGKMYSFSKIQPARPTVRNQLIINKNWLDAVGMPAPTNIDELKAVMVAFKEKDPNGNGKADEIAFSHNGDIPSDWFSPFGVTDINNTMMSITDGDPFFWPTSEGYKAGIAWTRELYELGVIDPEIFTQDWAMLTSKWTNEEVPLVGMSYQWTPDSVFGQWSSQYIAVPPIKDMAGKAYSSGDPDGIFAIMNNEAQITTQCKNVEMAAKWLDEFYTSEASIQNFWGAIGTVITKNDDGTYSLNNPPAGISADAWYWQESLRDFGPKFVEPGFNDKLKLDPTTGDGFKLEIAKMAADYVTKPFPNCKYTKEESDELALLATDIAGYCQQMRAKWVTEGGVDAEWDDYVKQLNAMGLERFIQIRMDAYNRSK
jgi:putative aldouronate transport system substrate-binding protein